MAKEKKDKKPKTSEAGAPPAEGPATGGEGDRGPALRMSLEELRAHPGFLAEGTGKDGVVTVVTKGGRSLRFPGDEERAAALTHSELTGEAPQNPEVVNGVLPPRGLLDLEALGCIMQRKVYPGGVVRVVTKGGRKLTFPGDEVKAGGLTDEELTGVSRTGFPRANDKVNLLGRPHKG